MIFDCIIIGGGPAGLNAALVLGRARRKIVLLDENQPRNAVTYESHGFITRDGVQPSKFKQIAIEDLNKYPTISTYNQRVIDIKKSNQLFIIDTEEGQSYQSRKVILATGLKDILPDIDGIHDFYGTSLFNCPFCDGWELRERKLVVISENEHVFHTIKMILNWSNDLVVCTNGKKVLTVEQEDLLMKKKITVIEDEIERLQGEKGILQKIKFNNGKEIEREGGFAINGYKQASDLFEKLGCAVNKLGGIETNDFGQTNIEGVYACGDNSIIAPAQLIIAAGEGSKAAIGVVRDLVNEDFNWGS